MIGGDIDGESSWGHEEEVDQSTQAGINQLCIELLEKREIADRADDALKLANKEVHRLEGKLLEYFKEAGVTSMKHDRGTFSISRRRSFKQPDGPQNREAFFAYLRSQGLFDNMISVNSRTLGSWAQKEIDAREQAGEVGWCPPGLEPATEFQSITVRKA